MIKQEQKDLAEYIKEVHLSLRRKTQEVGAEKAWSEHLKNEKVLKKYATCMKELAENYWSTNNVKKNDSFLCRIDWIVDYINKYFRESEILKEIQKEEEKMNIFFRKGLVDFYDHQLYQNINFSNKMYKLLDVGSCYDPFQKFDFLQVYPIDLCPGMKTVKKCNFIDVEIRDINTSNWFCDELKLIPSNYFDIVVFSLFLEYLPSPELRYICCEKAYNCLKSNGVLLIVTPDSKHSSANASVMKSWKIAAGCLGFVRTRLEKLKYLYCMAFRKAISSAYPLLLYKINVQEADPKKLFIIPQDSVNYKKEITETPNQKYEEAELMEAFTELPFS